MPRLISLLMALLLGRESSPLSVAVNPSPPIYDASWYVPFLLV